MSFNAISHTGLTTPRTCPMPSRICLFVIGLLVAAPVLAARPVKQSTPAVPVIVDGTGAIVGPVVPVVDDVMALAAVHRSNGERIKVLFDARSTGAGSGNPADLEAAATSPLRIRGPVAIWFPNDVGDCSGTGYVQDVDLYESVGTSFIWNHVIKEYRGYSPLFVYPNGPQSTSGRPVLVRVNWSQPTQQYRGLGGSRLTFLGRCVFSPQPISSEGTLFPVTFEGELNFTGPYNVE